MHNLLASTKEELKYYKSVLAHIPTPLIVTNLASVRLTSNSGRALIENFNLYK